MKAVRRNRAQINAPQVHLCGLNRILSAKDRDRLSRVLAEGKVHEDFSTGRTVAFALDEPFDGITALRIKGAAPDVGINGEVKAHTGQGMESHPFEVTAEGILIGEAVSLEPEGCMRMSSRDKEIFAAVHLSRLSDQLIGWGEYPYTFQREGTGFVIYGMPRLRDERLDNRLLFELMDIPVRNIKRVSNLLYEAGRTLHTMHAKGFIHKYPHFGNFKIDWDRVKIVDFETAFWYKDMPPQQRAGWLFRDFAYVSLWTMLFALRHWDGNFLEVTTTILSPFFEGYGFNSFSNKDLLLNLAFMLVELAAGSGNSFNTTQHSLTLMLMEMHGIK